MTAARIKIIMTHFADDTDVAAATNEVNNQTALTARESILDTAVVLACVVNPCKAMYKRGCYPLCLCLPMTQEQLRHSIGWAYMLWSYIVWSYSGWSYNGYNFRTGLSTPTHLIPQGHKNNCFLRRVQGEFTRNFILVHTRNSST